MAIETIGSLCRKAGYDLTSPDAPAAKAGSGPGTPQMSHYFDSSSTRRTASWSTSNSTVDAMLFQDGERLRAHCRDAVRKTPWAANAIDCWVAEAIGTGIQPVSLYPDPELQDRIEEAWLRWTDEADYDELTDFYGLQALAFREMLEAGEVLIRLHIGRTAKSSNSPPSGSPVAPLQLQVIEADHLPLSDYYSSSFRPAAGNTVRYGIEFDPSGKRVAYHLYRHHPGDYTGAFWLPDAEDMVRVPANEIIHMFRPIRAGQKRGQPLLTQVLLGLRDLDDYTDAARVRKKISALFAGFVISPSGVSALTPDSESNQVGSFQIETGTLYNMLRPGEDIRWSESPKDDGFAEFMRVNLLAIAAGCGLTPEQLTGDLSQVNYSSIRAGLLQFRRKCEQMQYQVVVHQLCRRVFQEWLPLAVLSGQLSLPQFNARRNEYMKVEWMPAGWQWVDPRAESVAALNDIQAGIDSLTNVVAKRGYNLRRVLEQKARENKLIEDLGLTVTSNPGRPAGRQSGQPQSGQTQSGQTQSGATPARVNAPRTNRGPVR